MKGFAWGLVLGLTIGSNGLIAEDEQRDYYAEPGLNPFASAAGQDVTENIDPFSGNVQLNYVDLSLPGNGGLDINITRSYSLPQGPPSYGNPFGYGWTMHFGRITIASGSATELCGGLGPIGSGLSNDNPSIEMPDGGRELLVQSSTLNDGTFVTKRNWKAACIDSNDPAQGLVATAPNGVKYFMREHAYMQGAAVGDDPAPFVETWLTDQIADLDGNTIDISYLEMGIGMKVPELITASDGRQVILAYDTSGGGQATLDTITANGQVWRYEHAPIGGVDPDSGWAEVIPSKLTRVERPDGTDWLYDYGSTVGEPAFNRLTAVTYPFGGVVNYSYQWIYPFLPAGLDFKIVTIDTKTQVNPGYATGTWSYVFSPGGFTDYNPSGVTWDEIGGPPGTAHIGRPVDVTEITTPIGYERIYHIGYWSAERVIDGFFLRNWTIGLKLGHEYFDQSQTFVRSVFNSWEAHKISDEGYKGGLLIPRFDDVTYMPLNRGLVEKIVGPSGTHQYTIEYGNHDDYGNPGTITEYAQYSSNANKVTQLTYLNDTANWLMGLPITETITEDTVALNSVTRDYWPNGRLKSEDANGVLTQYTYTVKGDVKDITDARNETTHYSNYSRGIAQLELYPDNTSLQRVVNGSGTVASETSGRANTTSFGYDDLNRLTSIDYPAGSDVAIVWGAAQKTLTRGSYEERVEWDGFGRDVRITRKDNSGGTSYAKVFEYDAVGRKIFESDSNAPNEGVTNTYDSIGRLTRVTHQDGTFKRVVYDGAHRDIRYDENNQQTEHLYQVFGLSSNKYLFWTFSPEGVATVVSRDAAGRMTSVFQGGLGVNPEFPDQYYGYTQLYRYNANFYLEEIDSPHDIGLTVYGRDALGNMTSKKVAGSNTTLYLYDSMSRLEFVDYLDDAIDVTNSYDADGNMKTVSNSFASTSYEYDANGNLFQEDRLIGANAYQIVYGLDSLDNVSTITYPSGRQVDYAPDALGRPTQALPYLTDVSYYPDGSLERLDHANGLSTSYTRTARKWIDTVTVGNIEHLDYNYDDVGNIEEINDLLNSSRNRSMTYDGLNRLKTVDGNWGASVYEYDPFSNVTRKSDPSQNNRDQYYHYLGLILDRITYTGAIYQRGFAFDDYGNIEYSDDVYYDPFTGFPTEVFTRRQQFFDDAGNLRYGSRIAKNDFGNIVPLRYGRFDSHYDGSNQRVKKIDVLDNNRETEYVYSKAGMLLGEYDETGVTYGNEYFYLGTQKIATAKTNSPPQVSVGDDIQTSSGATVNLMGVQDDLDGSVVSVQWTQESGPPVTIDDPSSANTLFTSPVSSEDETVVLLYTVTDDKGGVTTAQLTIHIAASGSTNIPPVADAGLDKSVVEGSVVGLDGSASSDSDGTITTYLWQQTGGSAVTLSGETTATPNFTAPSVSAAEVLSFQLTVIDDAGATANDTVSITVQDSSSGNFPPIANAGPNQSVFEGANVLLSATVDNPDGSLASFQWQQTAGVAVTLSDSNTPTSSFAAPSVDSDEVLTFQVTVTNVAGASVDTVNVTVQNDPLNEPPVADAGADQTVSEGVVVQLGASASNDSDGTIVSYQWRQISGSGVSLNSADTATPSFTAPYVNADSVLSFQLMVTDDAGAIASATVDITVLNGANLPPIADAGPDQTVPKTTNVQLDGSASTDPDGIIKTYLWVQVSGTAVTLSGTTTDNPSFTSPDVSVDETLTFQLTVTDGSDAQASDSVDVMVASDSTPPYTSITETHYKSKGKWVYEITLSANEPVQDIYWRIDNTQAEITACGVSSTTAWQTYTCGPIVIKTLNQDPIFEWYATDLAGNVEVTRSDVLDGDDIDSNVTPVADAGVDQSVTNFSFFVLLNGNNSSDVDGLIQDYEWTQLSGPNVALNNQNSVASYFNPSGLNAGSTLTFQLLVRDDGAETDTDTVSITIVEGNQAPVADAGLDKYVEPNSGLVSLNGQASYDPDGDAITYKWTQISGPALVIINNSSAALASFDAPQFGVAEPLVFRLLVTDDQGESSTDTVEVHIGSSGGGPLARGRSDGAISLPDLFMRTKILQGNEEFFPNYEYTRIGEMTVALYSVDPIQEELLR